MAEQKTPSELLRYVDKAGRDNNFSLAVDICDKIISEFPDSEEAKEAKEKKENLEVLKRNPPKQYSPNLSTNNPKKSYVLQFILTVFLGPLGLLYSRPAGAIILIIIAVMIFFYSATFYGRSLNGLYLIIWIISIIGGLTGVKAHNSQS